MYRENKTKEVPDFLLVGDTEKDERIFRPCKKTQFHKCTKRHSFRYGRESWRDTWRIGRDCRGEREVWELVAALEVLEEEREDSGVVTHIFYLPLYTLRYNNTTPHKIHCSIWSCWDTFWKHMDCMSVEAAVSMEELLFLLKAED